MSGLHVEVTGSGPDLLLLHGWGLNVRVWDGLVDELSDRFRMIAVDLPGHGRSPPGSGRGTPAEQAWLILQALSTISDRYSLLGWSLGGQIALDLAAAMPWHIEKLVLVATTPKFVSGPDWPYGMAESAITKMATQLQADYEQTVSDFLELQVRGSAESASVLTQLRQALIAHGAAQPDALEVGLKRLAGSDLRATLLHVQMPTLVIAGQNDRITPPSASRALAGTLPNARYVEMRRSAHAPFLSHRAEFAELVAGFLLGTSEVGEVVRDGVGQRADTPDVDAELVAEALAAGEPGGLAPQGTAGGGTALGESAMREVGKEAARQALAQMALARQVPGSSGGARGAAGKGAAVQRAHGAASGADTVAPVVADVDAAGKTPSSEPQRPKKKRIKGRAKKKMQRRHQ
jgi:pimeloyl-[acyl-carrier protein] methyl ester esterase